MKKKTVMCILLSVAALTACTSDNNTGDRGDYEVKEETPTPTEEAEEETVSTPDEAAEETPTPTEAEVEFDMDSEKSPFALWSYAGYLDEANEYIWQDEFINKDYDGDGITDRVYREHDEDAEMAVYTIEFGNGSKLKTGNGWETGFPHIQAGDVNGDGETDILFTLSYDTSTDPMSFGEMWVFEFHKDGGVYEEMGLPLADGDDGNGARCLELEYSAPDKNTVGVSVKQNGFTADAELEQDYFDFYWKSELTENGYAEKRIVWAAEIKNGAIHCSVEPFSKYGDNIEFDLVYNGKSFDIKEMKYVTAN